MIAAHLAGDYRVYMYGFAPGYDYLAGVPAAIRQPPSSSQCATVFPSRAIGTG